MTVQVYELADELAVRSVDVIEAAAAAGVPVRDAGSVLDAEQAARIRSAHRDRIDALTATAAAAAAAAAAPAMVPAPPPPEAAGAPAPVPLASEVTGVGGWGHGDVPVALRGKPPMHPLIKTALWQFALAQFVPCLGLYFFFAGYINAGKGRRQIRWWRGKWGGDTAGLVIQILFWIELVVGVLYLVVTLSAISRGVAPTSSSVPR